MLRPDPRRGWPSQHHDVTPLLVVVSIALIIAILLWIALVADELVF